MIFSKINYDFRFRRTKLVSKQWGFICFVKLDPPNMRTILLVNRGFSVKLAPKTHPVCSLMEGSKAEK